MVTSYAKSIPTVGIQLKYTPATSSVDCFHELDGTTERFHLLAKGKAHLSPTAIRVRVEATARDDGHSDLFDEVVRERGVVVEAESRKIAHDIIGASRGLAAETETLEIRDEE